MTKMRYFVTFSYDGSRYHGWQIQPNGDSVQAQLQRGLSLLLRSEIIVTGAGRTDAGVHARMMVAHFDYEAPIDEQQLAYKLNKLLPRDIAVSKVERVADDLHARFSATSRMYRYYLHTAKDPFFVKTTLCHITVAEWKQTSPTTWFFEIRANRFLRNMVRAVVGTLVDVGRGRVSMDDFRKIIEGKKRTEAGESMPAHALFLEDVTY